MLIYSLSLKRMFLSMAAGLLGFVPIALGGAAAQERLLWILPPFLWVVMGLQGWLSVYRFRRFLQRSVAGAPAAPAGMSPGGFHRFGRGKVGAV